MHKQKQWQFWKISGNKLVNQFQLVKRIDKNYYKQEDINQYFEWLTYDYHKVPKNIGIIEVDQGVFASVRDNEGHIDIVIRPNNESAGDEFKLIYTKNNEDWFVIKHISSGQYLTFQSLGNINVEPLTTDVELVTESDTVCTGMIRDDFLETASHSEAIFEGSLGVNHDVSNAQNSTLEESQDQTSDNNTATSEQKLFACTICTKVFKANNYLKKHVKNVHEGKKPKQRKISSNHDDFDQLIGPDSVSIENCEYPEHGENFETTKSGNSIVYHHNTGYNYHKSRVNVLGTIVFLRCQFYRSKKYGHCSGSANLLIAEKRIDSMGPHSHEANDKNSKIHNFFKFIRNKCMTNPGNNKDLFEKEAKEFCQRENIDEDEVSYPMIESSLMKRLRALWPKIPHSIQEVVEEIENNKDKRVLRYFQKIVRYSTRNDEVCSIIFGKKELIDEFQKSDDVGQDGTFKTCPSPFYQVYIITFKYQNYWFPAFVILMMRKAKIAYVPTLYHMYKNLAPNFKGKNIHQDQETASKKATRTVLKKISAEEPERSCLEDTKLSNCMFHWCSCMLCNVKKHGLIKKYWHCKPFKDWVRRIMLICLLPADCIENTWNIFLKGETFESFTQRDNANLQAFKDYVTDTWMTEGDYDFMSLFNVEVNTTNGNERINRTFNTTIGPRPHLWVFLEGSNDILDLAYLDVKRLKKGNPIRRKRPRISEDNLKHRKFAELELLSGGFTEMEFLNFLLEKLGTTFFQTITDPEEETDLQVPPENLVDDLLCKVCKKARNGQNWAFAHSSIDEDDNTRTIHSGNCTACKNEVILDSPCPQCGRLIEEILKMF